MKAVILAGGLGTRISEESVLKPKPMIEIGGKPIIWHIMKIYSAQGVDEFVVCLGYKGYVIKEYFANYFLHMSDVTFDMRDNTMQVHQKSAEPWKVTLVETGEATQTGGRLKRVAQYLGKDDFCFTSGEGVADVFLYPGGPPIAHVDALLTNFHLPRSSLLMLVCAFAGREAVLRAYHEAVAAGYRFYSYGDAMLIV